MRILVVEDERLLCDGIAEDLELEKYTVDRCYDGADAYERLFVEPYDLVILDLDTVAREISVRGEPLSLTPREFAILEQLMLCQGRWLSQEALMEHIWEADANPFSNAVRMHISSLRKKLRDKLGYDPIQTKVGQGYRLAGEEPI